MSGSNSKESTRNQCLRETRALIDHAIREMGISVFNAPPPGTNEITEQVIANIATDHFRKCINRAAVAKR